MKTWKLVSGILSIIMFVFVTFQSCAAGISNSIEDNGDFCPADFQQFPASPGAPFRQKMQCAVPVV